MDERRCLEYSTVKAASSVYFSSCAITCESGSNAIVMSVSLSVSLSVANAYSCRPVADWRARAASYARTTGVPYVFSTVKNSP